MKESIETAMMMVTEEIDMTEVIVGVGALTIMREEIGIAVTDMIEVISMTIEVMEVIEEVIDTTGRTAKAEITGKGREMTEAIIGHRAIRKMKEIRRLALCLNQTG